MPAFTNLLPTSMMSQWKATLEKQVSTGVNQLMSTASQSIVKSVNTWALSNSNSIKTEVDKALQPFLNSLKQQAISSLGSVSLPSNATSAAQGGSNTPLGASTNPQAMWDTLGKVLDSQKSIADSNKQIAKAISQLSGGTTPAAPPIQQSTPKMTTGGGGATRERSAGEESMIIAAMTETVHGLFEKMSEVRNEMYSTLIQGANLQRQLNFQSTGASSSPSDIRPFVNRLSQPGMEQGYTKQEAFDAAQTLALAGGNQTNREVIKANEAMVSFAGRRGFDITQWSQVMAGAETAGLFGGARGTQVGAKGVEDFQNKVAGMYQIASMPGGGSRGTTQNLDDFASEVSNVASVLGEATGNSENMTKAFQNMGKEQGNVFDIMTKFSQSNNLAVSGQAGVQTIAALNQGIQNAPLGSQATQAMAAAIFPGLNISQRYVQMQKGLSDPQNFTRTVDWITSTYRGKPAAQAQYAANLNLTPQQWEAVKKVREEEKSGKTITEKDIKGAMETTDQSDNGEAIRYRKSMEALTKSTEELASNVAPLIAGFDKLNGMLFGLPEIALGLLLFKKTLGDTTKEAFEFAKSLFKGKEAKKAESEVEKLLGKGKGQSVYVTNECLRICGGMPGQQWGQNLKGEAEAAAEGEAKTLAGEGERGLVAAAEGPVKYAVPGMVAPEMAGLAEGTAGGAAGLAEGIGITGLTGGSMAAGAGSLLATIAAPEVMIPLAAAVATGYAVTHPKQTAQFLGGAAKFIGHAALEATGIPEMASMAQGAWKMASGATSFLLGSKTAGHIGTWLGHAATDPFGLTDTLFGKKGQGGWRGDLFGTKHHVGGFFGDLASSWIGDPAKNAWQTVTGAPGRWWESMNKIGKGEGLFSKVGKEGFLGTLGDALKDTFVLPGDHRKKANIHEHAEEAKKHKRDFEKAHLAYQKGFSEDVLKMMGVTLDKTHPISGQTKSDLTTNAMSFLKSIGTKVVDFFKGIWSGASDWFNNFIGNKKKSDTGGGGNSGVGGDSGTGGGAGDSYGYNTFSNYRISTAQGTDIGPTSALKDDTEAGNVYAPGVGAQVKLPQGARYNAKYSTKYNSMFTLPDGRTISIMHIDANRYKDNQYVKAGTSIGTVTTAARGARGPSYGDTNSYGFEFNQSSDSGVFEADIYDTAKHAANRTPMGQGQYNISDWLASLHKVHTGDRTGHSSSSSGGGKYPKSITIHSPSQGSKTLTDPRIIKTMVDASRVTGVPLHVLAAQGFAESTWQANPSGGVPGGGWAQFIPETAKRFGLKPGDRTDPLKAIPAEARMMAWAMKTQGGSWNSLADIDASLTGLYGTDAKSFNNAYNNLSTADAAGGGSGHFVSLKPEPIKVEIDLRYPDGTLEKIIKTAKFQGVAGIHVQHNTHKMAAHHANKRTPRR